MKINAVGCSLVDNLYSPVDFSSSSYSEWTAEAGIENGLITGGLIFGDDLERTAGLPYEELLRRIAGGGLHPERNIGGPAVVAVIHMTQLLNPDNHRIGFIGAKSDDGNGRFLSENLDLFGIDLSGYITAEGGTPFTDVLSDPAWNDGNGERTFINYIGAAGAIKGADLPESFFDADMLIFGGTALTPGIHDDLSGLLREAKRRNIITCVNTVYDFRNQKKNPAARWPLVSDEEDFALIDLLIADFEEAVRISGKSKKTDAASFFIDAGAGAVIITHGAENIVCASSGGNLFAENGLFSMPVSSAAGQAMKEAPAEAADTTGCGDNFAGGVYTSLAEQLDASSGKPSLKKAVSLGAVSGGFAGLYRGGVFFEEHPGEKKERMKPFIEAYNAQTGEKYD